jgi:TRAP-type C4-dicarboxylate transport system substrate-binding protein
MYYDGRSRLFKQGTGTELIQGNRSLWDEISLHYKDCNLNKRRQHMRGRDFLKWIKMGILIAVLVIPAGALAADITLKLGHEQSPDSPYDTASLKFAEHLSALTKGKVEIKIFNNSQFGSPFEHWAQLKTGAIDLFVIDVSAVNMVEAEPKNFMVMTAPYLFDTQAQVRAFCKSDFIKSLMAKVEKANNMKYVVYIGDRAPRGFATTNKRIVNPEDLKGLKLRVSPVPIFVATYKAWGANPTPVITKEIYTSLKSGMIDGVDWDIISIYTAKYHEIQKYYTAIDWMRSGIGMFINTDKWNSLPEDVKKAFVTAGQETEKYMNDWNVKSIAEAEKAFKAAGIEVIKPDLKRWKEIAEKESLANDGKVWEKGLYQKIKAMK